MLTDREISEISKLVLTIAEIGESNPLSPPLHDIAPFKIFLDPDNKIIVEALDERDGACTRRELIARFLLLCAVLDQGPDIEGVRLLLSRVVNSLYANEIRIFHRPLDFFRELNVSAEEIMEKHRDVKRERQAEWAAANQSKSKYNLFMDGTKQVLNYAIFRWGVPLALPYFLEKTATEEARHTALIDHLESYPSAEMMSQELKDDEKYGLGKAIGDKACHLFAKWVVSTFSLTRRSELSWGDYSFEIPYDSNAGRVLWRTGYLLKWATEKKYESKEVIQRNSGKKGLHYIRVTNILGMKIKANELSPNLFDSYKDLCVNRLMTHKKAPQKPEIQRLQHIFLMQLNKKPAAFDDGLIHVGRTYCFNHASPDCKHCPLQNLCVGYNKEPRLIDEYRT